MFAAATVLNVIHVDGAERLRAIESTFHSVVVASWAGQEMGFLIFFLHFEGLHTYFCANICKVCFNMIRLNF